MNEKNFFKRTISIIGFVILLPIIIMLTVDPYFHYHKPLKFLSYRLDNERYMNDGIMRNFDYDAIITGTSMTENFKTSQFDELFDKNSIKVPFSGGSYKEINNSIKRALDRKKDIKIILRGLDYGYILQDSEKMRYESYPEYLYDDNLFNDFKYLLNKDIIKKELKKIIIDTKNNKKSTTFDEYANWEKYYIPGKKSVLSSQKRPIKEKGTKQLSKEEIQRLDKNIEKNVLDLPKKYPNVKFIYFITPYSIVYWDSLNQKGEVEKQIMSEKYMIEKILEVSNIELYSFFYNYDIICDLDNYKDAGHYMGKINDKILEWISKKEYLLTKENYQEYINKNLEFYKNYNYDKIYE